MLRRVTALWALALLLLVPATQAQQVVTVRDIVQIPQANIDQLQANADALSIDDIRDLVASPLAGEEVQFTAVLLTEPFQSALRSVDADGSVPIHGFVRDTSAASLGLAGMTVQIADGTPANSGLTGAFRGDVVTIVGTVGGFNGQIQIEPTSVQVLGSYTDLGFDDSLLDPVAVTTSDINAENGDFVQANWERFNELRQQFVRIEDATILDRTLPDPITSGNPQLIISSDNGDSYVQFDTRYSTRYNNGRIGQYPDEFDLRDADNAFIPPPVGAVVNTQGFTYFGSTFNFNDELRAEPDGAWLQIVPFRDEDLVVTEAAPTVTTPTKPAGVPGAEAFTVTTTAEAAGGRTLADVVLKYETSLDDTEQTLQPTSDDGFTYTFEIPAQPDGTFVTYFAEATDNEGGIAASNRTTTRVLVDGINEIADIQTTVDGGFGDSPFLGATVPLAIEAVVQTNQSVSGFLAVQDDPDLGPWSGIVLFDSSLPVLQQGDRVRITEAEISQFRDVTQLSNVTLEVTGSGEFLGYRDFTTAAMQDPMIAEAYEGMLVRFDDVVITSTNPDDPNGNFGEFAFATQGSDASVRADDASDNVPGEFNDTLLEGQELNFIQGLWSYSFGNYKLQPESVDMDIATDVETGELPGAFALEQNYPNPFNPQTTIAYNLGGASDVRLTVFDVLGREVAVLVDRTQPAGTYTVAFDAQTLPSGLYLYRLEAGGQTLTRSMLLLK